MLWNRLVDEKIFLALWTFINLFVCLFFLDYFDSFPFVNNLFKTEN